MNETLTKRIQLLIWVHCLPQKLAMPRNLSEQRDPAMNQRGQACRKPPAFDMPGLAAPPDFGRSEGAAR